MAQAPHLPEVVHLSVGEKLQLIEALWDSLEPEAEAAVMVPDWHRAVLDERITADDADAEEGAAWAEVRRDIEQRR